MIPVEFNSDNTFSFNVYPNPNTGANINLALSTQKEHEVLVVVYDVNGKECYSKVLIADSAGENVYAIDPSHRLIPGVYIITATSAKHIISKRLIIR